jgi:hypothetical protein
LSQSDPFEIDGLRIAGHDLAALRNVGPKRPPRHRRGERFLCGPVPWEWIRRAGALPGKALAVGLALWMESGCTKSKTVKFSKARVADLGCHPHTVRRGLRQLESAELVSVDRPAGRCLAVTLLEVHERGALE